MNVNQRLALGALRKATPTHRIEQYASTHGHHGFRCSCGWRWGTTTRNALGRASEIYGAEFRHLKEVCNC